MSALPPLPNLKALYLNGVKARDESLKALAASVATGALSSVVDLRLNGNAFGDEGTKAVALAIAGGTFAQLESLSMGGKDNETGDEGMKAMMTSLR